jgi:condensin complex subunit 2
MEDISTSFCFICLLHLANEQGLKLEVDPSNRLPLDIDDPNGEIDDAALKVGDIWGLNVYRDPHAARAA